MTIPFDCIEFRQRYPRKKKPRDVEKAYAQARKRASHERIMEGLERMISAGWDDIQFVPYPATWLRADQWDDELDEVPDEVQPSDRQKLVTFISKEMWRDTWPNKPTSIQEARDRLERLGQFQYETHENKLRIVR